MKTFDWDCKHGITGGANNGCQECIDSLADEHGDALFEELGAAAYGLED